MLSDIYAKADVSKKVRCGRKVKESGAEWQEMEVDIYRRSVEGEGEIQAASHQRVRYIRGERENMEVEMLEDGEQHRDVGPQPAGAPSQNRPPVHRKYPRGAALGLGLLCLLLTAVILVLSVLYATANRQLQEELKKLMVKTKDCPEGWTRFGSSCYFKFTENKTWSLSLDECKNKVSHLVKIDSREEQEFVAGLNMRDESWIGLRSTEDKTSATGYRWEWLDDSALTETFWADGRSDPPDNLLVVSCCDQDGKWIKCDKTDKERRNYICEK